MGMIARQSHERVLSEKYPLHFCHREAERSDAERSMHFLDSATLLFVNFTSVFSADSAKSFHVIALNDCRL